MRVALVHDWLTGYRGGERVLRHLAMRFPDADLFTLFHRPGSVAAEIEDRRIFTSRLDRFPGKSAHYRKLLPLFPLAIRQFDFSGYDLILSTSHSVAKSVRVPAGVTHIDYCFTPMRYIWDQADAYLGRGPKRWLAAPAIAALRRFDVRTSGPESVTRFVAISTEVADRIRRHYGREANVVAPPVDLSWIECAREPAEDFYLHVAGFVPYKRDELVTEAFSRLNRRLVVVGTGPGRTALERSASPNVEFVGRVDDAELARLYRTTRALIHPQLEDFGLVAVEVQAAGRPVIAFGAGGVLDTVRPYRGDQESNGDLAGRRPEEGLGSHSDLGDSSPSHPTGIFFDEPTADCLIAAIERFEKAEALFEADRIQHWARRFSPNRFDVALDQELAAAMDGPHE